MVVLNIEEILTCFEEQLDLYNPEGGPYGCSIFDYGEVTVAITLEAIPGKILKRMSGFISRKEAEEYIAEEKRYFSLLLERGITPLETSLYAITGKTDVVYIVQDLVDKERLGNSIIHSASPAVLRQCLESLLERIISSIRFNNNSDNIEAVADSQLSNWYFPVEGERPLLIDVGSPITRVKGKVYAFTQLFYRSFPWPLSSFVKLLGAVESYFNEYFDLRLAILDILGNYYKEQASERISESIIIINRWLAKQPEGKTIKPITIGEVKKYYGKDAALLELMFQVRRCTRFVRNKIFRSRYDYILPGKVKRL
jgi:hypothetical protein